MKKYENIKARFLTAVVANSEGEIFELDGYAAVGMAGKLQVPLSVEETVPLPYGTELMFLPDRNPIVYNLLTRKIESLAENPYRPGETICPVAAFNSPGFIITYVSAFKEQRNPVGLPLFSYGAVGWHQKGFRSAAICVDKERRQDLRLMPIQKVEAGIHRMQQRLPANRLREHLENCAMTYGCPAAKNFFLGRYEAPLPTATTCNARCVGCISLQGEGIVSNCQERIKFTPQPEEISALALEHIRNAKHPILSFGQGCEGDPLLAADVIGPAIQSIRARTDKGTINMNTNGSRPDTLLKLFNIGLDSVRVSMNSVRENCYTGYFRPRTYRFADVVESIDLAKRMGKFVSINYLNCPGFTDSPEEIHALVSFLNSHPVDLIQWRNLNIDPVKYIRLMNKISNNSHPLGIKMVLGKIKTQFPKLKYGYFNPPKETFYEMV
ncbi:MAG: radical SAM protein [Desulfobacterales bacterium]|nr:radical SAM protein [Desulfobacterales bacterium]